MHPNYEYVLKFIRENSTGDSRSLDYGCGGAEVVRAGRDESLNVYGVELFYEGGNKKDEVARLGYLGSTVRELENGRISFPDAYFDVVVNNMVLEHVEDLDAVLREISRVLSPGGVILSLFPSRETWFEGHCGIPFLHRFKKESSPRILYAYLCRSLGMGYFKNGKTKMEWAKDFCVWLDRYTFYRRKSEIDTAFKQYFQGMRYIETDFLLFRLRKKSLLLYKVFKGLLRFPFMEKVLTYLIRRKACLVIEAQKV